MSIFQMSVSAAILILVIIIVRKLAIHKLPKSTFLILWGVVLFRMLIPFSVNLPVQVYSSVDMSINVDTMSSTEVAAGVNGEACYAQGTTLETCNSQGYTQEILPANGSTQEIRNGSNIQASYEYQMVQTYNLGNLDITSQDTTSSRQRGTSILDAINTFNSMLPSIPSGVAAPFPATKGWIFGVFIVALFVLITHFRARKEYEASLPVDNLYIRRWLNQRRGLRHIQARQSDRITAPLTYGLFRPVILFPKTTDWHDIVRLRYILTHELIHISRYDILTKWLLAVALCVHWFNPLVWAMYILANRDIELSCDEAVVRAIGESSKPTYAMALIGLEERRRAFAPLYTNFSKNLIDERIVAVMKLKKRSVMSIILAVAVVAVLTVGALTVFASSNPQERPHDPYDVPCENSYVDTQPIADDEMYNNSTLIDDEYVYNLDEPGNWEEWLEWFNSLTLQQQAQVSLRPPRVIRQDFLDLRAYYDNDDIMGSIYIPNTTVNYLVTQTTDNSFYLYHNIRGDRYAPGWIFFDYLLDLHGQDQNMVVYGHNMRRDYMFHSLRNFLDEDFFHNNRYIYLSTIYADYVFEVFSAHITHIDFPFTWNNYDNWDYMINEFQARSRFTADITVSGEDRVITLVTCDPVSRDNRIVVHGVLRSKTLPCMSLVNTVMDDDALVINEPPVGWESPYKIATTLEEVMAIIARQDDEFLFRPIDLPPVAYGEEDTWAMMYVRPESHPANIPFGPMTLPPGSIPVTNLEVPEIINRQAYGIIVTEQCLYEALALLNETYHLNTGAWIRVITTHISKPVPPPTPEMQEQRARNFIDFLFEIYEAAVADGLLEGGGIYPEDYDLMHEEAQRMFAEYGYCDDNSNWPTKERAHEAAQRLFGGQE